MAEIGKKGKSPAKPRKDAARKDKSLEMKASSPSREQIARLAEKYWAERGYQDGHAEQDWLRAEQELHHHI